MNFHLVPDAELEWGSFPELQWDRIVPGDDGEILITLEEGLSKEIPLKNHAALLEIVCDVITNDVASAYAYPGGRVYELTLQPWAECHERAAGVWFERFAQRLASLSPGERNRLFDEREFEQRLKEALQVSAWPTPD